VNIPKLARDISALKTQGTAPSSSSHRGGFPNNNNIHHQAPEYGATPKEIYNAEDFQYQKRQEVEMKMREKEAEMRSYFEVPRPKEIDFSDIPRDGRPVMRLKAQPDVREGADTADDNGDSPLATGDDMDKLIAERIAARQRDLDIIGERMKATMPPEQRRRQTHTADYNPDDVSPVDASPTPMPPPALQSVETRNVPEDIRRVRFQEEDTRKVRFQEEDTNPIFLKLKRKPMEDQGDF
jgi:hypothetical protein